MFNLFKKSLPFIEVTHYSAYFKTIDDNTHQNTRFRYVDSAQLNCSIPEYLMCLVKKDGYLQDDNGLMYPLQNIIQIEWKKDGQQTVKKSSDSWTTFY